MTIVLSDDFNRADSASSVGSGWTNRRGTCGIASNQAYWVTGVNDSAATYDTVMGSDDVTVTCTIGARIGTTYQAPAGIILGCDTNGVGVMVVTYASGSTNIMSMATGWGGLGTATNQVSTGGVFTTADVMSVERVGNVYTVKKNGSASGMPSWTDSGNLIPRDSSHRLVGVTGQDLFGDQWRLDAITATDTVGAPVINPGQFFAAC